MVSDILSDIELYYSGNITGSKIVIEGEESHHITNVMRHKSGDSIYITDGKGTIFKSEIALVEKKKVCAEIVESSKCENRFRNICFCIPRLRSSDRFEYALEKSVELGITKFIVFDSTRSVAKGEKIERWEKILTGAMKQSLRCWLPKVSYAKSVSEIIKENGIKIFFDQHSETSMTSVLTIFNSQFLYGNSFFIFGPEGGLTEEEMNPNGHDEKLKSIMRVRLTGNRLRSETAIVTAASLLSTLL